MITVQVLHVGVTFSGTMTSPSASAPAPEMPMQMHFPEWSTNEQVPCQRRWEWFNGLNLVFVKNECHIALECSV